MGFFKELFSIFQPRWKKVAAHETAEARKEGSDKPAEWARAKEQIREHHTRVEDAFAVAAETAALFKRDKKKVEGMDAKTVDEVRFFTKEIGDQAAKEEKAMAETQARFRAVEQSQEEMIGEDILALFRKMGSSVSDMRNLNSRIEKQLKKQELLVAELHHVLVKGKVLAEQAEKYLESGDDRSYVKAADEVVATNRLMLRLIEKIEATVDPKSNMAIRGQLHSLIVALQQVSIDAWYLKRIAEGHLNAAQEQMAFQADLRLLFSALAEKERTTIEKAERINVWFTGRKV